VRRLLAPWTDLRGLPPPVWATCFTTFINRMGTMALPFLALFLTEHLGYSQSRAGLAVSCYGLAGFLTAPYAGRLTDRIGPARLLLWALVLSGLCMALIPLLSGYASIVVAILIWATINEAVRPASFALLTDAVPPHKKRSAIALFRTAINLGMSFGPAAGGFLAAISYSWVFGVDALTCWLAALVLVWSMRSMPRHIPAPAHGKSVALRDRRLWLYLFAMLPVMVVFFQHTSTMPLYMVRDLQLRPSVYGALFTLNTLLVLLFEIPITVRTGRWRYQTALPVGALLMAAGFAALGLSSGVWTVAMTVVIWTVGEMLLLPASAAYLSDLAPPGRSGEYVGLHSALISMSMLLAPAAGTFVLERYGPASLWIGCGAVGGISVMSLALLEEPSLRS
jgi:MFS family permease